LGGTLRSNFTAIFTAIKLQYFYYIIEETLKSHLRNEVTFHHINRTGCVFIYFYLFFFPRALRVKTTSLEHPPQSSPFGGVRGGRPLRSVSVLLSLCVCLLCEDTLELGLVAEVLELLGWSPLGRDLLDVLGGEVLEGAGTNALERDVELTEFAKLDCVAGEEVLLDTRNSDGEDTDDVALGVDTAMGYDVLSERVDVEHSLCLSMSISTLSSCRI